MDSTASLHRAFTALLIPLARHYRRYVDKSLAGMGLRHSSGLTVMLLAREGDGVRQNRLADLLSIEGPSLVRQLDQMESAGLVERRPDPEDGRAKLIFLTETGRALAEQVEDATYMIRTSLLRGVPDAELTVALGVLEKIEALLTQSEHRCAQGSGQPERKKDGKNGRGA